MNERPAPAERDTCTASRRGILRGAATVAAVGSVAGCLVDFETVGTGTGDADADAATDAEPGSEMEHSPVSETASGASTTSDTGTAADAGTPGDRVRAYERAIHGRVNEVRANRDRGRLEFNDAIADVARAHSEDMAQRDYFAHESPEGDGPADRLAAFFPEHCRRIGENLANVGTRPDDDAAAVAERVVSGWLDSEPHRENLLAAAFDEEGIGVAMDEGRVLATQNLCATGGVGG